MQPPITTSPADPVAAPEVTAVPATRPKGKEAEELIRRAPASYLWNQINSMWQFLALFLYNIVIVRGLGDGYGALAVALTLFNTLVYIAAFGLEDAASVFVPRMLGEAGRSAAAAIVRRTLVARMVAVIVVGVAVALLVIGLDGTTNDLGMKIANTLRAHDIRPVIIPLIAYLVGTGLMNLFGSIFTSLLRTRLVLFINGFSQLLNVSAALLVLRLGLGSGGILWAGAAVTGVTSLIFLAWLFPLLATPRGDLPAPRFGPVLRLGGAAWLTNLISGALLKQSVVWVLGYFAITDLAIGQFNLAFQLSHAAAFLLIAGLGGVGMAAMAAAYSGDDLPALGTAWRAVSKVQVLLAVPLLGFVFIHAQSIAVALYGVKNIDVGYLMQVFLVFNIIQRLLGGGAHQAGLYVVGKQGMALLTQWIGLIITIGLGIALVPLTGAFGGASGALIAVGAGQAIVELLQLLLASRALHRRYPLRFSVRVCLALIPPMVVAALWRNPAGFLQIPDHIAALGAFPVGRIAALLVAVIIFAAILIASLAIAKPIEREDVTLLAATNPRLRPVLSPFASGPKVAARVTLPSTSQ